MSQDILMRSSSALHAHAEGKGAYENGAREKDNPYPSGHYDYTDIGIKHRAWRNGYQEAWLAAGAPINRSPEGIEVNSLLAVEARRIRAAAVHADVVLNMKP